MLTLAFILLWLCLPAAGACIGARLYERSERRAALLRLHGG
jgi:hypothetical protein